MDTHTTPTTHTTLEHLDAMSDEDAEDLLYAIALKHPETVDAVISATLIASPTAGPVRILREILAVLDRRALFDLDPEEPTPEEWTAPE